VDKQEIYEAAMERLESSFPGVSNYRACLYCTWAALIELSNRGIIAIPQGGSMSWPMKNEDQDDGVSATHWSYVWSPDSPNSIASVAMGHLPEMHIWAGIPETQEVVDFSTYGFVKSAEAHGFEWTGDQPPDFFWGHRLPDRVVYEPNQAATCLASGLIKRVLDMDRCM
jgi:hypothetical protein